MILQELYNKYPGYQDENDDQSKPKLGDLRKTKLTLRQLNKLRRMNDIRKHEKELSLAKIQKMYGSGSEEAISPAF
jgi:hypothetical protein